MFDTNSTISDGSDVVRIMWGEGRLWNKLTCCKYIKGGREAGVKGFDMSENLKKNSFFHTGGASEQYGHAYRFFREGVKKKNSACQIIFC